MLMNANHKTLSIVVCMWIVLLGQHVAPAQDNAATTGIDISSEEIKKSKNIEVADDESLAVEDSIIETLEELIDVKLKKIMVILQKRGDVIKDNQENGHALAEKNKDFFIALGEIKNDLENTKKYIRTQISDDVISEKVDNYLDTSDAIASRLSGYSGQISAPIKYPRSYETNSLDSSHISSIVIITIGVVVIIVIVIVFVFYIYKNEKGYNISNKRGNARKRSGHSGYQQEQYYLKGRDDSKAENSIEFKQYEQANAKEIPDILENHGNEPKQENASGRLDEQEEAGVSGRGKIKDEIPEVEQKEVLDVKPLVEWWNKFGAGSFKEKEESLKSTFGPVFFTVRSYGGIVESDYEKITGGFEQFLIGVKDPDEQFTYVMPHKNMTYRRSLGIENWFNLINVEPAPNTIINILKKPATLYDNLNKPVERARGTIVLKKLGN